MIYLDTCLVADESHPAIMGPGEGVDRSVPVVDQLNAPPSFVLNPHEDDASGVTRCKLLVRFVPFHHRYLQ